PVAHRDLHSFPTRRSSDLDVDDTAALNGRHGYQLIDGLLARLGSLIRERCGGQDIAARIGGDEFALSLWEAGLDEATHEVEHVRDRKSTRLNSSHDQISYA